MVIEFRPHLKKRQHEKNMAKLDEIINLLRMKNAEFRRSQGKKQQLRLVPPEGKFK